MTGQTKGILRSNGLLHAIQAAFGDGKWHETEEVVAKCGHLIPPEIAIRRERSSSSRTDRYKYKSRTLTESLDMGRRYVIRQVLKSNGAEPGGPGFRDKWTSFRLPRTRKNTYQPRPGQPYRPNAKLNDEIVVEILRAWHIQSLWHRHRSNQALVLELCKKYHVSTNCIRSIVNRVTWGKVPWNPDEDPWCNPEKAL